MTVSGELCCVALPFCCVVVALPFSASLEAIVHAQYLVWGLVSIAGFIIAAFS